MKDKNKIILFCLSVVFIMILLIKSEIILPLDQFFYHLVGFIHFPWVTILMKWVSNLGSAPFYFIVCLTFIAINRKWGIILATNVTLAFLVNATLKLIFTRERPLMMLVEASGYSLPSGHSCSAMAFYGTLFYLISKSHLRYKKMIMIGCECLIFLIGFSRIYLRVHYFSDVVTGFMLGMTVILFLLNNVFKKWVSL